MSEAIEQLFSNLDSWQHLPAFDLGRKADIFISVYLPEYLKKRYGYDVQMIIPDFPIRVGTVRPLTDSNGSFKIDYFIKVRKPNKVILLKFRTNNKTSRPEKDWYLAEAKRKGIRQLLTGLKKIVAASSPKSQFDYLLERLECTGLIQLSGKGDFRILDAECDITIIYVQPDSTPSLNIITFTDIADFISEQRDDLSQRFARSLREWGKGHTSPPTH
jgi:hypothetical protein